MRKKAIVMLLTLIGVVSVGYAYHDSYIKASGSSYHAGGSVAGRVITQPTNINKASGVSYGFQQYDVLEFNTMNTHMNKPLAFKLIEKETYTDYASSTCTPTNTMRCNNSAITAWYSLSNDRIDYLSMGLRVSDFINYISGNAHSYGIYSKTAAHTSMKALNTKIDANAKDRSYLTIRNLTHFHDLLDYMRSNGGYNIYGVPLYAQVLSNDTKEEWTGNHVYTPSASFYGYYRMVDKGYGFGRIYWSSYNFNDGPESWTHYNWTYDTDGNSYWRAHNDWVSNSALASSGIKHDLRAAAYINQTKLNQVVFAVSAGTTSGRATIINNSDAVLQPRTYNSSINVSLNKLSSDTSGTTLKNNKTAKDSTIYLYGTGTSGNTVISALIFDRNGNFLYYEPLDSSANFNSNGYVALDTTNIPIGSYQIALVNEEYDESIPGEMKSSKLSTVQSLEIVDSLSITATARTGLEYSKNVNQNNVVATFTTTGGVSPITTTLVSDTSVSGHSNDYQLFSLSNGNVIVKDAQGLNAGDYYFKVNAIDANKYPTGGVNSSVLHIQVKKTKPTINFDDVNTTKKSITDAGTAWNETATASPTTGIKVSYSVSGGDVGLIDIDKDSGAITYKGSGAFGKVKIKAIADDDPSTGNDNYDPINTEKEIVIYREVDGNVTPDPNSSDSTIPTFKASDANVKTNGIIGTIKGTYGTPDSIGGSTTTYTYGLKAGVGDANFFSVDPNTGVIKSTANLGVKAYSITVTVSDKWSTKEIPITINVGVASAEDLKFYENSTSNTVIITQSAKITDTNVFVYATVKGSGNTNPVTYKVKDGSTTIVEVNPTSGKITPKGVGSVTIVAEKAGASGQAKAVAELTFTVTAGEQDFIYTDVTLSNELPKSGDHYDPYVETYQNGKNFQLYTAGYPSGATVTYQLKADSPTDVISVDSNGLVHILNASISPSQIGKVIVEATSHDPSNHYADKTIELPINITKANQTISFKEITYVSNGSGSVTPVIIEQDISSNAGGVNIADTDYYISVDTSITSNIAYTNDGKTIHYDYTGESGLDIPLHVVKQGNRNYEKAEADGKLHIMDLNENILATTNVGRIVYGDHFEIKSLQDDSGSTNVQYQFEVDDTTYVSNPTVNGNKAEFDALKFSGNTTVHITVTRTADTEKPLSKTISVQVLPKEIEIIIDDKDKYKGEANPTLTYQDFKSQLVSWSGVQDVIQEHDIKLSTTAQTNSQVGSYPIKGDANSLNNTYPNYSFKFVDGTLEVKEDNIEDSWYHMELADGGHTPYTGTWTNQDVDIISDHPDYIHLSLDQSTWKPQKVTVSKEGENNQSFWMKKDSGAITKEKQEIIRIDKTPPKVKGIKAKDSNNVLQDIIYQLSFGTYFKPGTAFEITTSDTNGDLKVSGTKEISYKIYKIESAARSAEEEISSGTLNVTNEKASITISETTGTYRVCVIPTDHAENSGEESCHEVTLKKIDIDVDGDGKPDFNDPDGDGCPDLNIKWKDLNDSDKWIVINGDRDNDGIPDLNIDSNGDGKADLNIDTDHDGKPDLNLVILKKSDWQPTKCVKQDLTDGILEEYCTGTKVKAVINVDTDGDNIPDINIDTNGDMKADFNISKDGKTPSINIGTVHTVWEPNKDYTHQGFTYDTSTELKPLLNIDSDGDGRADINLDLDGDGIADINIDTDGDGIPDINIDGDGDGKADINIDKNDDGNPDENIIEITEWNPKKDVNGDIPYDTMEITLPNDSDKSQEPSDPQEPQDPKEPDETKEPNDPQEPDKQSDPLTNVQGNYYPGNSVGGASTGDTSNLMMYAGISLLSLGALFLVIYKKKAEN